MLFCIDIGNTNVVLGITEKNQIHHHWRIRTEKEVTPDELGILVMNLFRSVGLELNRIKDVIISCVVPPLLNTFEEFSVRYFDVKPLIVGPETPHSRAMFAKFTNSASLSAATLRTSEKIGRLRTSPSAATSCFR